MMTELEALIAKEVSSAKAEKEYTFSIKDVFNGHALKIKPLSTRDYYRLIDECTHDGVLNSHEFHCCMIAECLVDPNLMSPDFQKAVGSADPRYIVSKVFPKPGIVRIVREKIESISGFDDEAEAFQEC